MSVLHHDDGLVPTSTDPHPWTEPTHPTVLHLTDEADAKPDEKVDDLAAIKGIAVSIALSLPFWAAVAMVIVKLRS